MTKKLEQLVKVLPPKRPLTTLSAIVEDWQYRFGPGAPYNKMRDHVTDYCLKASSVDEAVVRACDSRSEEGKTHNHQSKVPRAIRTEFGKGIIKVWRAKLHSARSLQPVVTNFDALYDLVNSARIWGIGNVTEYDVATRIAAYLKLEVQSLYLHAGVLQAWKILKGSYRYPRRIPRAWLPREFISLPTDEIEDMLCTYRDCWPKAGHWEETE